MRRVSNLAHPQHQNGGLVEERLSCLLGSPRVSAEIALDRVSRLDLLGQARLEVRPQLIHLLGCRRAHGVSPLFGIPECRVGIDQSPFEGVAGRGGRGKFRFSLR